MIVCEVCGTANGDGERFCGQCGAFLEWAGADAGRPAAAQQSPTPSVGAGHGDPGPAGTSGRAAAVDPVTGPAADPVATWTADPVTPRATEPVTPRAADPVTPGATDPGATRAAGPVTVPTADPAASRVGEVLSTAAPGPPVDTDAGPAQPSGQPAERMPAAVQPGQPVRRRPPVAPVEEPRPAPRPGERVCGRCGTGNDPSRRFCRSCGAPLAEAAVVRLPWWRRLLGALAGRSAYAAGERRSRRDFSVARRLVRLLALVVVLAVLVVFGRPLVSTAVNAVRDRMRDPVYFHPVDVTASSARRGAAAERIADGASNRYWAPAGKAEGAWVEAAFGEEVRIVEVMVTPGVSKKPEEFLAAGRPRDIELRASTADGGTKTVKAVLRDEPGPQTVTVKTTGVLRIRLTVRSTYGPGADPPVAVGELEFVGRG
jgi:hypothetical protein